MVFWAGSPVAWKSGRQSLVTTSSAETELLAASEGATLTYSIDAMLADVGISPSSREIRVDNSAAITLASEEGGSWRTRHLKVRAAALRQRIQEGWASIAYCPGEWQLADGLTKVLASKRMEMLMRKWGLRGPNELPREENVQGGVRCLQAPADQQQQPSTAQQATADQQQQPSTAQQATADQQQQPPTAQQVAADQQLRPPADQQQSVSSRCTAPSTAHGGDLGCCMGLLVLAQWFVSAQGHRVTENDPLPEPLALSNPWELYVLVTMLVICAVAIWEGCKSAVKSRGEAVRLRSVAGSQDRQRLTKVELRTLSALLQRDRQTLTRDERMDLIHLAGLCGSDVSEAVGMSVATPATGRPLRTVPEATCSAGIDPAAEDMFDMPPPPPPEVPRPAKKSSKMSPTAPLSSWENPVWTERPELVKCPRRSPERRQCDAAVQCELLGEIPKRVFMTPRGTCVHASRSCSTLSSSTKFQQRDMCQKCVHGQREETELREENRAKRLGMVAMKW